MYALWNVELVRCECTRGMFPGALLLCASALPERELQLQYNVTE